MARGYRCDGIEAAAGLGGGVGGDQPGSQRRAEAAFLLIGAGQQDWMGIPVPARPKSKSNRQQLWRLPYTKADGHAGAADASIFIAGMDLAGFAFSANRGSSKSLAYSPAGRSGLLVAHPYAYQFAHGIAYGQLLRTKAQAQNRSPSRAQLVP